jgi:primosomal protein N' (replication factor Y) (superfamily II helicase)
MNADNMLHFPDFRTFEHSFQQLSQVSGRAGRKNKQGRVVVQTYNPYHSVIKFVMNHDFEGMYRSQINERFDYKYPPFYRLIKITLKHRRKDMLDKASSDLAKSLKRIFANRLLGPEYPLISRIRSFYLKEMLIKIEKDVSISSYKLKLSEKLMYFSMTYKSVRVIIDIDPQ